MSDLRIEPIHRPFTITFTPPGSKSLTNRALVLAALADGRSVLSNVLFADDTRRMLENLQKLGFELQIDESAKRVEVVGRGGEIPAASAELFCGLSGTTVRFLTALCTLGSGEYTLDGVPRLRQRPIGTLVDLIRNLGGRVTYLQEDGFVPLNVHSHGLAGGIGHFGKSMTSQNLSAILQIGPYARHELRIELEPNQTSWPYVAMTMRLMDEFGLTPELVRDPETGDPREIIIPRGSYAATNYAIEPDASNATYFLAAAAVNPGSKLMIERLGKQSLQGDVGFAEVLHRMGAGLTFGKDFITISGPQSLEGIDVDLSGMPDTAQTLAVVALFAEGPTTIRGLFTLRVKETDRLAALSNELTKLGAEVEIDGDDALTIHPPEDGKLNVAEIDTYDDHRMAMSFAVAGTRSAGVTIRDIECVNKTYPRFFDDLRLLTP